MNKAKFVTIDAKGKVLGRLASIIASILRGKDDPKFAYNQVANVKVTVFNAKGIVVTGNKLKQKNYYRHSGRIGNLKTISFEKIFTLFPEKALHMAVKNMLPKNRLQNEFLKNLTILNGELNAKDSK